MLPEERLLLERAQHRDVEAFEKLMRLYEADLFRLVLPLARNREDGEDALQEVLLRAYKSLPTFRGDSALLTWLTRTALNITRNWPRSQSRTRWGDQVPHADTSACDEHTDPTRNLVVEQDRQALREALRRIPDRYRAPLIMRHYQEMSYADIADVLESPVGTVRSRLAQGRALLLRRLRAIGHSAFGDEERFG